MHQGWINTPFIQLANLPVIGIIIHFELNQSMDIGMPDAQLFCETACCRFWIAFPVLEAALVDNGSHFLTCDPVIIIDDIEQFLVHGGFWNKV